VPLINNSPQEQKLLVSLDAAMLEASISASAGGQWKVQDIWERRDVGTCSGCFEPSVPAYDNGFYLLTPVSPRTAAEKQQSVGCVCVCGGGGNKKLKPCENKNTRCRPAVFIFLCEPCAIACAEGENLRIRIRPIPRATYPRALLHRGGGVSTRRAPGIRPGFLAFCDGMVARSTSAAPY
jgi:hypothetical protein